MSETHDGTPEGVTEDTAAVDQTADDQATATADDGDTGDDAAAADDDGEGEQPKKPRKSPDQRIAEVTRQKHELAREKDLEIAFWRERATSQAPQQQRETAPADAEPNPDDYEYGTSDARFIEERAVFRARKEFQAQQAQADANNRTRAAVNTFEQRVGEQFPDGEPAGLTRLRALEQLSPIIQETIFDSDIGPKLADHLGQNPRELNRISALPPVTQARELAKLEMKLATPPAPTAKIATDAPAPTERVRGAGGQFKPAADTTDFSAFDKTYGR